MKKIFIVLTLLICSISYGQRVALLGRNIDAQKFIQAAVITDATQQMATNTITVQLKMFSLWTKMKAIYPIVGGTSTSHAVNLKTPGTYDLVFTGSPTHASNGVDWNGTTQSANTGLNPNTVLGSYSTHMSYYSGENVLEDGTCIGADNNPGNFPRMIIWPRHTSVGFRSDHYDDAASNIAVAGTTSLGFFIATRTSSTDHRAYRAGTEYSDAGTSTYSARPAQNLVIGAFNGAGGGPDGFTTRRCQFASIGDGLTTTDAGNFNTAVANFQTTLGR